MSKLLISTALAGLIFSAGAAVAQPQDDHDRGGARSTQRPAEQHPADQHRQADQHQQHAAPQAARPTATVGNASTPNNNNQQNNNRGQNGGDRGRASGGDHRDRSAGQQNAPQAQPAPRNAMRGPGPGGPGPSNAMRGPGTRGPDRNNFASYHRNFNASHRFRAPAYRRPSGWYSHHWVYGEILPSLFWSRSYWLDDYNDFGLMPPPPGTVWVRDGTDALLIDQYSGEIIQVAYDAFY